MTSRPSIQTAEMNSAPKNSNILTTNSNSAASAPPIAAPPNVVNVALPSSQNTTISGLTEDTTSSNKREKPKTTARNQKKSNKIKKGVRVKTTRSKLYHVLKTDRQRAAIPTHFPNSAVFYGTVTRGNSGKGWTVKWDDLPSDECEVEGIKRQRLTVVSEGEEEKRFDEKYALQLEVDELKKQKEAKKSPEVASKDRFVNKKKDEISHIFSINWKK